MKKGRELRGSKKYLEYLGWTPEYRKYKRVEMKRDSIVDILKTGYEFGQITDERREELEIKLNEVNNELKKLKEKI